jgi:hypothetical protein
MSIVSRPATDDTPRFDSIIELGTDDDAYGDPAGWPEWTDEDRWGLGPEPDDDGPTDADWDEMARRSEWQDRLEAMHHGDSITEADVRAAGLPI